MITVIFKVYEIIQIIHQYIFEWAMLILQVIQISANFLLTFNGMIRFIQIETFSEPSWIIGLWLSLVKTMKYFLTNKASWAVLVWLLFLPNQLVMTKDLRPLYISEILVLLQSTFFLDISFLLGQSNVLSTPPTNMKIALWTFQVEIFIQFEKFQNSPYSKQCPESFCSIQLSF